MLELLGESHTAECTYLDRWSDVNVSRQDVGFASGALTNARIQDSSELALEYKRRRRHSTPVIAVQTPSITVQSGKAIRKSEESTPPDMQDHVKTVGNPATMALESLLMR